MYKHNKQNLPTDILDKNDRFRANSCGLDVLAWFDDFVGKFEKWGKDVYGDFIAVWVITDGYLKILGSTPGDVQNCFVSNNIHLNFKDSKFFYRDEFGDLVIYEEDIGLFIMELRQMIPYLIEDSYDYVLFDELGDILYYGKST